MSNKVKFKRRRMFLKESSQPMLILKVYVILLTVMVLSGAIFYFLGNKELTEEFFKAHSVIKTTMQLFLPALILVNVIGLLGASFLVISFSHSIAGPVHRLKNLSEKIAEGDLTLQVQFREKDAIKELSGIMNRIIQGLNTRLKKVEGSLQDLQDLSAKVNEIDTLSQDELLDLKHTLLTVSTELEDKLKEFKL